MAVSHEVENGVVVQDLTDWDGETDGMDDVGAAWMDHATRADVDRIAFVSDGIEARAVSANLDVTQEIETFESVDAAVAWAGDA